MKHHGSSQKPLDEVQLVTQLEEYSTCWTGGYRLRNNDGIYISDSQLDGFSMDASRS